MHLYLQLTSSLAVNLIWFYYNKLVLCYVRLRVSDPGQVSIPQPWIVTHILNENPRFDARFAISVMAVTSRSLPYI